MNSGKYLSLCFGASQETDLYAWPVLLANKMIIFVSLCFDKFDMSKIFNFGLKIWKVKSFLSRIVIANHSWHILPDVQWPITFVWNLHRGKCNDTNLWQHCQKSSWCISYYYDEEIIQLFPCIVTSGCGLSPSWISPWHNCSSHKCPWL